jgi:CRP/FNR family transcriptional regulator, cyclic AMP receptor protein
VRQTDQILMIGFVPLFRGFSRRQVQALLRAADEVEFLAGTTIIEEGEIGEDFHLLLEGQATVSVGGRQVSRAKPGDYFGEMALIDRGIRSATVTADTDVGTLRLASKDFLALVDDDPRIARRLLVELCRRLRTARGSVAD